MTRPAANFNVISLTRVNQWPTSGHHLSSLITGKHACCGPASVTFDTYWLAVCCFCFHFAPPEHLLLKYSKLVWLPFFFECVPLYRYIGGGTFWRSRVFFCCWVAWNRFKYSSCPTLHRKRFSARQIPAEPDRANGLLITLLVL